MTGEKHWNYGKQRTQETKDAISSAKLGEKNIKSKKVYRYTLDGMYIDEFGSTHKAARKLGRKDGSNIAKCARGVKQTAYKFKWSYDAPV